MKKKKEEEEEEHNADVHNACADGRRVSCCVSCGLRRKPGAQLPQRRRFTNAQHATTQQLCSRLGTEDGLRVFHLWRWCEWQVTMARVDTASIPQKCRDYDAQTNTPLTTTYRKGCHPQIRVRPVEHGHIRHHGQVPEDMQPRIHVRRRLRESGDAEKLAEDRLLTWQHSFRRLQGH